MNVSNRPTSVPEDITVSPQLAKFLAELTYERIPDSMRRQAKKAVRDNVGVILAGLRTPVDDRITACLSKIGDLPDNAIMGTDQPVSTKMAAMHASAMLDTVNGMSGFRSAINPALHGSESTIPAALATARQVRCTGRDFLTAVVAGLETYHRIGLAVDPSHYLRGFFPDATLGCLASAVVYAKLHGSSTALMADTIGAAVYFVPMGLLPYHARENQPDQHFGWGKTFATPYAIRAGIEAAVLASEGFGGQRYPLEGARGFCNVTSDQPNLAAITDGLGESFVSEYAYYKEYFTSRSTHGSIDLALQLRNEHAIKPSEVKRVRVSATYLVSLRTLRTTPDTHVWECLSVSIPYIVATALLYPEDMSSPELYSDLTRPRRLPEVHEFSRRIELVEDKDYTAQFPGKIPTRVEIDTFSGQHYAATSEFYRGDEPELPLPSSQMDAKFKKCAGRWLSEPKVRAVQEMLDHIDELDDMSKLFDLCARA